MPAALLVALLGAFGALVAARYLASPAWVDALLVLGACLGLAVGITVGLLARRIWPVSHRAAAALILGLGALAARAGLVATLLRAGGPPSMHVGELLLACSTVSWGALALLFGAAGISEEMDTMARAPRRARRGPALRLAASAVAVVLALLALAPLGQILGLRLDHWTFLGLLALALAAHGAVLLHRRLARR